ncbi:BrnT family toxin [Glaciecola sp. 1036]|uniref:BrnT family toxin n=1 Tax=Alteromonadaceae TaxID=72275 RepID=UPI003CFEAAD4
MLNFEWDENKAERNVKKHGVTFSEATEVFGDALSYCVSDPDHSVGESRYIIFGVSKVSNHLVVSFLEKEDTIRIISARNMTKTERRAYEQ